MNKIKNMILASLMLFSCMSEKLIAKRSNDKCHHNQNRKNNYEKNKEKTFQKHRSRREEPEKND